MICTRLQRHDGYQHHIKTQRITTSACLVAHISSFHCDQTLHRYFSACLRCMELRGTSIISEACVGSDDELEMLLV